MVFEDKEGKKYTIVIDKSYTGLFLHNACFNIFRLIDDNVSSDSDYRNIESRNLKYIKLIWYLRTMKARNIPLK